MVAWLDVLGGSWPIIVSGSGLPAVGWLLYRCYRLRVHERMHAREVASAERRHARELGVAWAAAQVGATAKFGPEGATVMPPALLTEAAVLPLREDDSEETEITVSGDSAR